MLFSKEKRTVIITPMKAGSTTVHDLFEDQPGWIFTMGPHPWKPQDIEKHTGCFPQWVNNRDNIQKLLLIRNPYDRVASFYHHWCKYHDHSDKYIIDDWMEEQFIPHCMTKPDNYYNPCTVLYPDHTGIIRIEKLRYDLSRYGIHLDKILVSNKSEDRSRLSPRHLSFVEEKHYSDFVAGRYKS